MVFLYNAWGDIFKVKVSAGAKVGAKVRAFGVAKVGVNADIGSANPRSNSPILKTTTPCFGGEPTCNHCNCALGVKI
jgi:hypothetical protein